MYPSQLVRPLYLNDGTEGAFGLFHDAWKRRCNSAVLLCPPFGWAAQCPYRDRRDWAEHLAASGYPTLRIDLPGSGDSTGSPRDPKRLQAWTRAASVAAQWLRAASGAPRIVAVGIGLGGLVAYLAIIEHAPIDDLVLWGVAARGRALVRELRAYGRLPVSSASRPGEPVPRPSGGAVHAVGYLLSAETADALEALDLTELRLPDPRHRRVLLLGRSGPAVDERLHRFLVRAKAEVTVAPGPRRGTMSEVVEHVDSWLAEGDTHREQLHAIPEVGALDGAREAASKASSSKHLRLSCAGVELRETPVWVTRPNGRLFGVLTEALHAREQLCAVLLNAGTHPHTGPCRMWVEIARRWAACGVPTLRIDLSRIGDSDGDADALTHEGALYAPEYAEDTCAALDMLRARGLPNRFVLLGLCSGAYQSLHAALRDERVAAIVMLNPPPLLIWNERAATARYARGVLRRLRLRSTWRKALRGDVSLTRYRLLARALASQVRAPLDRNPRDAASRPRDARPANPLDEIFDALRDRGQDALLVLTSGEPLVEEFAAQGLFRRMDRWPNMECLLMETSVVTHIPVPLWLQQQIHEVVDRMLQRELQRVGKTRMGIVDD